MLHSRIKESREHFIFLYNTLVTLFYQMRADRLSGTQVQPCSSDQLGFGVLLPSSRKWWECEPGVEWRFARGHHRENALDFAGQSRLPQISSG